MTISLNIESKIFDAIEYIESGKKTIAPVVSDSKLIGTISDGDIRRAILNGKTLNDSIGDIFNSKPIYARDDATEEQLQRLLEANLVEAIPIVDSDNKFLKIIHKSELFHHKGIISDSSKELERLTALILAGGKGKRLMPLTETIPKPMIKVGNMPIIERQIRHLCAMGIREVYISTNYLGKIIEEYFETHTSIDASIEYIREEKFLGTAGPISLMPKFDNLLLINGDLLSDVNYVEMYKYHLKHKSSLTIGAVNHHFEIPYGVLEMNGEEFLSLREKPSQNFLCNAGIYIMTSDVKGIVPKNESFDMTDLIKETMEKNKKITIFPIHEKWIDIGDQKQLDFAEENIEEN